MKKIVIILAAALGLALGVPAFAQDAPAKVEQPWFMQSKLASSISVTTSSAATKLPTPGFTLWACNTGSNDAYLNFGTTSGVVATVAGGTWLKASTCSVYDLFPISVSAPYSYVAVIGSGGSTTVYVEAGLGQPPAALASGGGGGGTGVAGDATITSGGVAQNLFSGTTPTHGFIIINPNLTDDCWWSDSTTAAINGKGSGRLSANGGEFDTPSVYAPVGTVSVICPTTNDILTARRW